MKRFMLGALALGVLVGFSGCSTRLGNMTVVSTNNIDGLHNKVSEKVRVEGESCVHTIIIFPIGDFQNRLQVATDNAIDNGHKKGLKGDALVNAKIDVSAWYIPFIYGQNCMEVKGDLVQLTESAK